MNRRSMMTAGALAAAALPLATMARAQMSAVMEDGTLDPEKAPVILGGTFSKLTSQVALEKSQTDVIRTFAELEVAEQTAIGTAFGVPADAPPALPEDKAAELEQLQALEGAEFEMAYVAGQSAGHEELRGLASDYAANGADPMAKGAALVAVTEIDTHLVVLRGIKAQMG